MQPSIARSPEPDNTLDYHGRLNDAIKTLQRLGKTEEFKTILKSSGRILYSSAATLQSGDIYLLGLNPGGDPEAHATETIDLDLKCLPTRDKNAYVHEKWNGLEPGAAPLQKRVKWLCEALGYQTKDVCASNVAFVRSKKQLPRKKFMNVAALCWPVQRILIEDVVQPRLILTFGKDGYDYLDQELEEQRADHSSAVTFPSGHPNGDCQRINLKLPYGTVALVGIPHLSRYAINHHPKVAKWIRESLSEPRRA